MYSPVTMEIHICYQNNKYNKIVIVTLHFTYDHTDILNMYNKKH